MTIDKIFQTGTLVAILKSKETRREARIYAACESRGYQTKYLQKLFFFFVPYSKNGLPLSVKGITRNARRKNIPIYSNVTVCDQVLYNKFMN